MGGIARSGRAVKVSTTWHREPEGGTSVILFSGLFNFGQRKNRNPISENLQRIHCIASSRPVANLCSTTPVTTFLLDACRTIWPWEFLAS